MEQPASRTSIEPAPTASNAPPPPPPPAATRPEKPERPERPEKKERKRSFWREIPVLVLLAFVVALLIKSFLLQAFYIPSGSMEPTLMIGDRVLVEKVSYRFGDPGRGDVVVFERSFDPLGTNAEEDGSFWTDIGDGFKELFGLPTAGSQDFIKRVIAVGGDTIQGKQGAVYLNGEILDEPYLPDNTETTSFGPIDVPEGEIFVMGDNRANSDDSRNFGPVPEDTVVGKAFVLIWPPSDAGTL